MNPRNDPEAMSAMLDAIGIENIVSIDSGEDLWETTGASKLDIMANLMTTGHDVVNLADGDWLCFVYGNDPCEILANYPAKSELGQRLTDLSWGW